jgi:hypothetical protein
MEARPRVRDHRAVVSLLSEPLVTRCAWCARYQVGDEWLDEQTIGEFTRRGTWMGVATHGICPGCVGDRRRRGLSH